MTDQVDIKIDKQGNWHDASAAEESISRQTGPDAQSPVDESKRIFLRNATVAVGAVGAAAAVVPFVGAMLPDRAALALARPVRVKIGQMGVGDQLTVMWRGKPIWIIRRDAKMLATLVEQDAKLRDPLSKVVQQPVYAQNINRSIEPDFLVVVGICTHLGCAPTYRPEPGAIDSSWLGGFYCSCHGSRFDLSGRVYQGVPATMNLEVPPYYFASKDELVIGESQQGVKA